MTQIFKKGKKNDFKSLLRSLRIHEKIPQQNFKKHLVKWDKVYSVKSLKQDLLFISNLQSRPLEILLERKINEKALVILDIVDEITRENKIFVCYHLMELKEIQPDRNQNFSLEINFDDESKHKKYQRLKDTVNAYFFRNPNEAKKNKIYFYTNSTKETDLQKTLLTLKKSVNIEPLNITAEDLEKIYLSRTEGENIVRKAKITSSIVAAGIAVLMVINFIFSSRIEAIQLEKKELNLYAKELQTKINAQKVKLDKFNDPAYANQTVCPKNEKS